MVVREAGRRWHNMLLLWVFKTRCQMDYTAVSFTFFWTFWLNYKIMNIKVDHILHLNYNLEHYL